jgi:hypothetical protein
MDEPRTGPGLDDRQLQALRERVERSPFHRWAGMELQAVRGGEAEVRDGTGKLLARASATFIILPAPGAF